MPARGTGHLKLSLARQSFGTRTSRRRHADAIIVCHAGRLGLNTPTGGRVVSATMYALVGQISGTLLSVQKIPHGVSRISTRILIEGDFDDEEDSMAKSLAAVFAACRVEHDGPFCFSPAGSSTFEYFVRHDFLPAVTTRDLSETALATQRPQTWPQQDTRTRHPQHSPSSSRYFADQS